ncbi:MAG: M23 family metallopeptidase [Candidatus Moduliflexus flocculans]|nr:M23 family metallopeptidase [Candidatus Moduliflexus flocculans]
MVAVNHNVAFLTLYGHNATIKEVTAGDRVDSKTVIALSGNTGDQPGRMFISRSGSLPGTTSSVMKSLRKTLNVSLRTIFMNGLAMP